MGGSMGMSVGNSIIAGVNNSLKFKMCYLQLLRSKNAGEYSFLCKCRVHCGNSVIKRSQLPYVVVLTNPTTGGVTFHMRCLGI